MSRYFVDEGISTYTHVSDQLSTYGTKVVVATQREATYVLDEILGNQTDLPVAEHATDTAGANLVNFALFDLVGKQFSPRIRDLGKITLYRTGAGAEVTSRHPYAGPLLTRRANKALVSQHWDDLLRLAASLKFGHATAPLVAAKLSASGQQNTLVAVEGVRGAAPWPRGTGRYDKPGDEPAGGVGDLRLFFASKLPLPRHAPRKVNRPGFLGDSEWTPHCVGVGRIRVPRRLSAFFGDAGGSG